MCSKSDSALQNSATLYFLLLKSLKSWMEIKTKTKKWLQFVSNCNHNEFDLSIFRQLEGKLSKLILTGRIAVLLNRQTELRADGVRNITRETGIYYIFGYSGQCHLFFFQPSTLHQPFDFKIILQKKISIMDWHHSGFNLKPQVFTAYRSQSSAKSASVMWVKIIKCKIECVICQGQRSDISM